MKLFILFILNIYTLSTQPAAAPVALEKQTYPLYFLTNIACKVSILLRMKTPTKKQDDENIIILDSEPGKNTFLEFETEESFLLRGISMQPDKNRPAEYTEGNCDSSLPEYGIMFPDPPTIGAQPLVLTINETYEVKGLIEDRGVVFTHNVEYALRKTGKPTTDPITEGTLPLQS